MSSVTCHLSPDACHLSPVTCHMSLTTTAIATDPPPANFPTNYCKLVRGDQKSKCDGKKCVCLKPILDLYALLPALYHRSFSNQNLAVHNVFFNVSSYASLIQQNIMLCKLASRLPGVFWLSLEVKSLNFTSNPV